jgi:hypothetical protein
MVSTGGGMSESDDRLIRAIQATIRETLPQVRYLGVYEYRVLTGIASTGYMLISTIPDMPDLNLVKLYNDNGTTVFTPGSSVLVGFINGDPSRPFIAHDGALVRHGDALVGVTVGAYVVAKAEIP